MNRRAFLQAMSGVAIAPRALFADPEGRSIIFTSADLHSLAEFHRLPIRYWLIVNGHCPDSDFLFARIWADKARIHYDYFGRHEWRWARWHPPYVVAESFPQVSPTKSLQRYGPQTRPSGR